MQRHTVEHLRAIRTFPALVEYLASELDWPIEEADFEDLTFDYSPEELGLDSATAAKIDSIKQLRPLSNSQPWGIFFAEFEPKRLPVVALRRILGRLVVKKRASANAVERAAWQPDDLMFVSSFGEDDRRQISFAHFSQPNSTGELPTLKVLGWDNLDTPLHLDSVAETLSQALRWPDDESDVDGWREMWRTAFRPHREVIKTAQDLSMRLADLARAIRDRIATALSIESETGLLTKLMSAFREALIHDLDADGFADMYAQTVAYGLLSARIADPKTRTADDLAGHMRTNPFLRELLETFMEAGGRHASATGPAIDFDELGVFEVVELLDDANMDAVLRDFGDQNPQEDPVIHFYEHFLAAYDKRQKVQRGVFYTPRAVVSYIVRSVDELLRSEFGLSDGLADVTTWGQMAERHDLVIPEGVAPTQAFVQILDPATGTGTFLVEVIDVVYKTMAAKWRAKGHSGESVEALWNDYVPTSLLPRLHGYELLMAPYAVAHMKVGLKLYETGYRFGSDERAQVYLTNALEPPQDFSGTFAFAIPALAHEAEAVNAIKRDQRFTVVIGNPPYSGESMNKGGWIRGLVDTYMYVDGSHLGEKGKKNWLQDDYVKFLRFAQFTLDQSGTGICGLISNHGFIDNPTFRGMRASLGTSFHRISLLDLHGNAQRKEIGPEGITDENVFDIMVGVAITFLRRVPHSEQAHTVGHSHLWGDRGDQSKGKYSWLLSNSAATTDWLDVSPTPPFHLFVPQDIDLRREYDQHWKLTEAMPHYGAGIITSRDHFITDFEDPPLRKRLEEFRDERHSDEWIRSSLNIRDNSMWSMSKARRAFREEPLREDRFVDLLYRPLDGRRTYFETNVVFNMRIQIMRHMLEGPNISLLTARQATRRGVVPLHVSRNIVDAHAITDATSITTVFPLFLFDEAHSSLFAGASGTARPNLSPRFVRAIEKRLGLDVDTQALDPYPTPGRQSGAEANVITPADILHYAFATLYSPTYAARYVDFLKVDFPHVPLTSNLALFRALADFGGELAALHLLESERLEGHITSLVGSGEFRVQKVSFSDETVWIDKARTRGFRGVPEDVWNFHIGGYQVCQKWLKDRQAKGGKNSRTGRVLTDEDIDRYQKIVVALSETIRLMGEIDSVIEEHGGWPTAFEVPN